jgi:hypothetical protein
VDNLTRELRRLADYHGGMDIAVRLLHAQQCQEEQRKALRTAADRIDALEMELRKAKGEPVAAG